VTDWLSTRLTRDHDLGVIPVYLLARLALDRSLHGQGLGAELLLDVLTRVVDAAGIGRGLSRCYAVCMQREVQTA
jgi:predicted N-acetyltransferase YhbS